MILLLALLLDIQEHQHVGQPLENSRQVSKINTPYKTNSQWSPTKIPLYSLKPLLLNKKNSKVWTGLGTSKPLYILSLIRNFAFISLAFILIWTWINLKLLEYFFSIFIAALKEASSWRHKWRGGKNLKLFKNLIHYFLLTSLHLGWVWLPNSNSFLTAKTKWLYCTETNY